MMSMLSDKNKMCIDCKKYKQTNSEPRIGLCDNHASNHYCHVLMPGHPSCDHILYGDKNG